jgi:hypothetical protein
MLVGMFTPVASGRVLVGWPAGLDLGCAVGGGDAGLGVEVEAAQELGVERDDDGGQRHQQCADLHGQHKPDGRQDTGGEWDRDDVVPGGPRRILSSCIGGLQTGAI